MKAEASYINAVRGLLRTLVGGASRSLPSRHEHSSCPPTAGLSSASGAHPCWIPAGRGSEQQLLLAALFASSNFFKVSLLYWLEAIYVIGRLLDAFTAVTLLQKEITVSHIETVSHGN